MVKITNIQVHITLIIPKLIDTVPSHAKESLMAWVTEYYHIGSQQGRVPMQMWAGIPGSEGGVGGEEGGAQANEDVIYNLPSMNVNPREWIKVNNYRDVDN